MHHALARQVIRQRPAHRLGGLFCFVFHRAHLGLRALQFLQAQLHLFDLPIQSLRGTTELHAAQLRDQQFQVIDLSVIDGELGALLDHHRLQCLDIIGQCCDSGSKRSSFFGS